MPFCVFIFLVFVHFCLSQHNYCKNIHESAASNLRRRVHSYSQKQFHHEKSTSFLSTRPFRMQIKIYWLAFLFHIRVSFYRGTPEKNVELFMILFSLSFFSSARRLSFPIISVPLILVVRSSKRTIGR